MELVIRWLTELIAFILQVFVGASPSFPSQFHSSQFIPTYTYTLYLPLSLHHLSCLIVFVSDKIWTI